MTANTKAKILVAEDDTFLAKVYDTKLAKEGYQVTTASDGEETLRLLKADKPDLLLLDLIMPGKTGFDVLEAIKKDSTLIGIPIIILSNLGQKNDVEMAMQLGASDYLIKSNSSIKDVLAKIENQLNSK